MRILFVSNNFPYLPDVHTSGIFNRMRTLVGGLAASGAEITCLFYVNDTTSFVDTELASWQVRMNQYFAAPVVLKFAVLRARAADINQVSGLVRGVLSFFAQDKQHRQSGTAQVQNLEQVLQSGFDLVFVHRLAGMAPLLLTRMALPPVMLDLDDIEHIAFAREVGQPPYWRSKYLRYLQLPALCWGEWRSFQIASKTLVCSRLDVAKLDWLAPKNRVIAWPNAVPMPVVSTPASACNLLFLGSFTYGPNVQAVEFLLREIWPLIRASLPNATLTVGGVAAENVSYFSNPPAGVIFAGYIADLNQAYAEARAVVCPILSGGGTRVKVVEAAAYGRAVVSTTVGAEGLDFVPGAEILLADTPQKFANNCVRLLSNMDLATQIGKAARSKAEASYDKQDVMKQLAELVSQI